MIAQGPRWGRWNRGGRKRERVTVGLGYLYNVLRRFNMVRLTRLLMRRPWHVADELRPDGQWVRVMAYPKGWEPKSPVADALKVQAAARAAETPAAPPAWPARLSHAKLGSVKLKPGMRLWQLVEGDVVEVSMRRGTDGRMRGNVDPRLPIVAAMNKENAARKLGVNTRKRA
ncbi:MAG TPA: hypothetical protein PKY96_18615 [Flavobacteriales bacterium]|nr:hypothetical protein [Flavobacteriales bacterium]